MALKSPLWDLWTPQASHHLIFWQPIGYSPHTWSPVPLAHKAHRCALSLYSLGYRAGFPAPNLLPDRQHGHQYPHQGSTLSQGETFCCRTWTACEMRGSVEVSMEQDNGAPIGVPTCTYLACVYEYPMLPVTSISTVHNTHWIVYIRTPHVLSL